MPSILPHAPPSAGPTTPHSATIANAQPCANDDNVLGFDVGAFLRFYTLIDEGEDHIEARTFDDNKERKDPSLTRNFSGPIKEVAQQLVDYNERGAGCFLVANFGGATDKDITRVRVVFADCDDSASYRAIHQAIQDGTCPEPHIIVETSPGRYLVVWISDGHLSPAQFTAVQKSIVARFGSDRSVTNPSRLIRVVGSKHQKGKPHLVRIIHESGARDYTAAQLLAAFPPIADRPRPSGSAAASGASSDNIAEGGRNAALTSLAGTMRRRGMSAREILPSLLAINEARCKPPLPPADVETIAKSVARYEPNERDLPLTDEDRAAAEALGKSVARPTLSAADTASSSTPVKPVLRHVAIGALSAATTAAPEYAVEQIVPRRVTTLVTGHGGVGKSTLTETIGAHFAAADSLGEWERDWAGFGIKSSGRVVFVSLEDPGELVRYRLLNIAKSYNLDVRLLEANFIILDGSEDDAALAEESNRLGRRTLVFTRVLAELEVAALGAGLIIVDNASDAFDADENVRALVRAFIRRLTKIARDNNAGLILLAHIDKAAARNGSAGNSYSGSTAWHNSARSRLALVETDGVIELRHEKANLGPKAKPVALHFNDAGVLMPTATPSSGERDDDDAALLECLTQAIARGESISTARTGPGSAYAVAKNLPGFPLPMKRPERFWTALGRFAHDRRLVREDYVNANRKPRQRWAIAPVAPVALIH